MIKSGFEATWYPRIGKDAAEELRRTRRTAWLGPLNAVFAVGAGLLIGTNPLGDATGEALLVGALVSFRIIFRAQWRTAAAISLWFDVKRMRWLPRMTPQRFDEWRHLRGLMTPDERLAAGHNARSSSAAVLPSGPAADGSG